MNEILSFTYMMAALFAVWVAIFIGATSDTHISRRDLMATFWTCTVFFIGFSVVTGFVFFG